MHAVVRSTVRFEAAAEVAMPGQVAPGRNVHDGRGVRRDQTHEGACGDAPQLPGQHDQKLAAGPVTAVNDEIGCRRGCTGHACVFPVVATRPAGSARTRAMTTASRTGHKK